ncbi:MAG: hypothetical protein AAF443_04230 [Chlamydiota bacterium]
MLLSPTLAVSDLGDGYCGQEFQVCYEGVEQRWIVVFSKAAYDRERRTLRKRCGKDSEKELKAYKKGPGANRDLIDKMAL